MKILILSFYYTPDLSAGSFRATALVKALLGKFPCDAHIEVITTLPNRYSSFSHVAPELEESPRLTVRRIKLPNHKSGVLGQAKSFLFYASQVLKYVRHEKYQLIFATSGRSMTAALSSFIARWKKVPLYLDIRDIFVDTIKDILPPKVLFFARPFSVQLERWGVTGARHVNLVSGGFADYFQTRYPQLNYSFFTNGIDAEFLSIADHGTESSAANRKCTVLYAGNMGEGQGLHKIIPLLANRFAEHLMFRLIGDGGKKEELARAICENGCSNVELLPPINREQLLVEYRNADVLFLHLNDYDAFEKVLPSKLFEYAAVGKPVWAGVSGFAATFVKGEIENAAVFSPCDVSDAVAAFGTLSFDSCERSGFIEKYSRANIMNDMADDILRLLPGGS